MTIEESIEMVVARALDRRLGALQEAVARIESSISPRLLTVAEAAAAMGCHENTVRRMIASGRLAYKRVGAEGRCIRIDPRAINGTEDE